MLSGLSKFCCWHFASNIDIIAIVYHFKHRKVTVLVILTEKLHYIRKLLFWKYILPNILLSWNFQPWWKLRPPKVYLFNPGHCGRTGSNWEKLCELRSFHIILRSTVTIVMLFSVRTIAMLCRILSYQYGHWSYAW